MIGGGERHPLQILATLSGHYSRVLRLSGSDATDEKSAAALLNLKGSTFPARKALDQARRLGPHGVARAYELLAGADLDMRGRVEWPDQLLARGAGRAAVAPRGRGRRPEGRRLRTARRPASS